MHAKPLITLFALWCVLGVPSLSAQEIVINRNDEGRIVSSSHRVLDANDHLAVLITYNYDSLGIVETRMLQSYDRYDRPLRKEIYTADEYLLYTEENRYDRHGNRTRCIQTTYDEEGHPTSNAYRYRYTRRSDGSYRLVGIRLNGKEVPFEE